MTEEDYAAKAEAEQRLIVMVVLMHAVISRGGETVEAGFDKLRAAVDGLIAASK